MSKHPRRFVWVTIVTGVLGIGCGKGPSPFAPSDPAQAARGIAAGPAPETKLTSATIAMSSAKPPDTCSRSIVIDRAGLDSLMTTWPAKPRAAVRELAGKYGMPLEASTESVVWHGAGPFARVTVTKREIPHDIPKPHTDFMEHTMVLDVPAEKIGELAMFDSSISVNKTAGELSVRGDRERNNVVTLDLAREIVANKKTVADARKSLAALPW